MCGGRASIELGEIVVTQLYFRHNKPCLWKFLDFCLSSGLLSPLRVLSLLSARVIPQRLSQPEAYRLFLELLRWYAFSFGPPAPDGHKKKFSGGIIG
ncbi:hypothetical protein RchiOBHm_Chr2g0119601 [Rosa chinensis]|uniref:Uncharacterized protein n=1 Tax=Rosa chinensis TaxID=74649 RepID=A0A2P6RS25_ROSCH|nr:hypothetical protein RchiOBHm_Chr2g0119601 [Rosa chinensis]